MTSALRHHNMPFVQKAQTTQPFRAAEGCVEYVVQLALLGRSDVMFDLRFDGDVAECSAYINCTVLERTGDRGKLHTSHSGQLHIPVDRKGWYQYFTPCEAHRSL